MAVIGAAAESLCPTTRMAVAVVDRAGHHPRRLPASRRRPAHARHRRLARPHHGVLQQRPGAAVVAHGSLHQRHPLPARHRQPANAALYGVENINRGCDLDAAEGRRLQLADRATALPRRHVRDSAAGGVPLPCNPADTRGCAVAGPIRGEDGKLIYSFGITTGKTDLRDSNNGCGGGASTPAASPSSAAASSSAAWAWRASRYDRAEFAALTGAVSNGRGITTAINFPEPLPEPGAIFIDGLRLPFVEAPRWTSGPRDRRPAASRRAR